MPMLIRAANVDDALRIGRIHFSAVHGLAADWYSPDQLLGWCVRRHPHAAQNLATPLARGDAIFIAVLGGKRVGFSQLSGDYIRAVYVRAKFARKGIGAALLNALEQEAIGRGIAQVHLDSSLNAVPFYEHHGYRTVERTNHKFSNGTEIACAMMRKSLLNPAAPSN